MRDCCSGVIPLTDLTADDFPPWEHVLDNGDIEVEELVIRFGAVLELDLGDNDSAMARVQ
jgi:hypothetical protein